MPTVFRPLLLAALLALAGCVHTPSTFSDRLFFGRAIPGGGEVTDAQWRTFVAEVIEPRFPEGFTLWVATGHWRGDDGASVTEPTLVLEVIHNADQLAETKLREIAQAYRQRFNQDAVLQVRSRAELKFWRR